MTKFAKSIVFLSLCILLLAGMTYSQITVTSPSAQDRLKACEDYADEVLLDRWDMNQRTDVGWRTFNTVELPLSYLTNITFQNGIFSATSSGGDPNFTLLDSAYLGSAMLGKIGTNFPIDANKYTHLVIRMNLGISQTQPWGQLLWSKNTIYGGQTTSGSFFVHDGWFIYIIDIPSLGVAAGPDPWNGLIDSLRVDPIIVSGKQIQIDWVRLVDYDNSLRRTIRWTGNPGNVDIYLDNDTNAGNGNLGQLARNVGGTSYAFLAGGLAPGDYYIAIAQAGANPSTANYSSGYYRINDAPIVKLTSPSAEGSNTDFITLSCSDPWDMSNSEDVEHTMYLQNPTFTTINYEDLAGNTYNNKTVFRASSVNGTGSGDPIVFFLHFLYRGMDYQIDASKYKNLVFKMGIWGTQSVNDGSIARVMWRNENETVENVSQDIIIRHLPNKWIMNKVVCDLDTLEIEPGAGSPSHSGWNGWLDCFRIDPHEFTPAHQFFFDDVKITTDCTANSSYTIEWDLSDSDDSPSLSLYYDNNNSGYNGTLITSGLTPPQGYGSYVWDTSGISAGTYWVYAVVNDGDNTNRCYATGPLVIDHVQAQAPEISLSKDTLYFGAERNGPATPGEQVMITNSGEGALNWQATSTRSWINVSPSSGGSNSVITINVDHSGMGTGTRTGQVRIEDPQAVNSPQIIDISLTVYGSGGDSGPFGAFDTPGEGSVVSGSVAVTGWALDDINVSQVLILRDPVPTDPPQAIGDLGLVYVGEAVFVKGARPDIENLFPTTPCSDRAGWGYMMLTYGLPNKGNGNFRLHAYAIDSCGREAFLGAKQITSDNNSRVKPFGTIDTPGQGEVISGGGYSNFGWALTPPPNMIPTDGSTMWISVDSVFLGNIDYDLYRADIADSFPEYLNKDGAIGHFLLDTTQFTNGVHNIGWLVQDNAGNMDGIGSRFFEIQNLGGASAADISTSVTNLGHDSSGRLDIQAVLDEEKSQGRVISSAQGHFRPHFPLDTRPSPKNPNLIEIEVQEMDRMVVNLQSSANKGIVGWGSDVSKALPIGSTLDQEKGIFYWMPGPGFLGKHVLHFAASDSVFHGDPVTVVIHIIPRKYKKNYQ